MSYIIGIDAGTTSVRSCIYNVETGGFTIAKQKTVEQYYPKPNWVEEDAEEIYQSVLLCLNEAEDRLKGETVVGVSLTNMRETVVCWNAKTGKPLYNAIIWQCRRTQEFCDSLSAETKQLIYDKTGLVVDAYFSASKIKYLIDNVKEVKEAISLGELRVGTIDSYLIYRLTGGKSYVTDITNASRTMLYNIHTLAYDEQLFEIFNIPFGIMPKVLDNDSIFGETQINGVNVPIAGVIGDQQSSLVGQGCFNLGSAKVTYGTGLFMLFNTGDKICRSNNGIISTVAYRLGGKVCYALEGSVFNAGTAIQLLRDNFGLIVNANESEVLANSVKDSNGVSFVPAFTGLGAPHWKSDASGIITGLTRGSTKAHVIRAALEAMAFAARELFEIMQAESGVKLGFVKADGGASANGFLMKKQAGELQVPIIVSEAEATVLGSIKMCLMALGLNDNRKEVEKRFLPEAQDNVGYQNWKKAVERCLL